MEKTALYLAGGGARGAYQAGVLKAIDHILKVKTIPFSSVSGVSVGSINACVLAENAHDFPVAVEKLCALWGEIHCQQIYNASNYQLGKSVLRNLSTILIRQQESGHLLDTAPLKEYITSNIDFNRVNQSITDKHLEAIELITHCYETQQTISFYHHDNSDYKDWHYPRHSSQQVKINGNHVLASSSLPLFFPAVKIEDMHYGDGSIGLVAPLRGAIRFQVNKILILGTQNVPEFVDKKNIQHDEIGFAHVLGSMMNGLFLDNLDRDIELVNRMNEISRLLSMWRKRYASWRPITTLHLRPSRSMANVALEQYQNMPIFLRFLLSAMGAKSHSGELLSFLLFEKDFTSTLIDLGYEDTIANAAEVEAFFKE